MKFPNKRKLQQIALNHSSDINSKDFIKIGKECTATLATDNPIRFRKNIFNI